MGEVDFIFPILKDLQPLKITDTVREIQRSKYYNSDYVSKEPSQEKFEKAFVKLKKKDKLKTKDFRILSYSIDTLESENYFEEFYDAFELSMNRFVAYRGFVRPLLSYIYNFYDRVDKSQNIYYLLLYVSKKLINKVKFQSIIEETTKYIRYEDFLDEIQRVFSMVENKDEIKELLKVYFIKDTDKFYFRCMVDYILKNYKNDELFEISSNCIKSMDLDMQQKVFKGILDNYINIINIEVYPDNWFKLIKEILKDPYAGANTRWDKLGEVYKETFRRWNNSKYLYNFFENIVGGDKERLKFWSQYTNSIYRIEHFDKLNDALVMEFKDDVFVEIAQRNNALYVYKKKIYNIDKIKQNISKHSKTGAINMLKDPYIMDAKYIHRRGWQRDFKYQLSRRGYEQDRW